MELRTWGPDLLWGTAMSDEHFGKGCGDVLHGLKAIYRLEHGLSACDRHILGRPRAASRPRKTASPGSPQPASAPRTLSQSPDEDESRRLYEATAFCVSTARSWKLGGVNTRRSSGFNPRRADQFQGNWPRQSSCSPP